LLLLLIESFIHEQQESQADQSMDRRPRTTTECRWLAGCFVRTTTECHAIVIHADNNK